MSVSSFFQRSELTRTLYDFRREFGVVALFSMVVNVLMLAPTLYMLQIYDRVMVGGSELTLLAVSLITLFLFGVMALADWARSRLMVYTSLRFDERLSTRVFDANFEARLSSSGASPSRAFSDLMQVRQFVSGAGLFALFDAPWVPIYLFVLFVLNPWLLLMGCFFAAVQIAMAVWGHRRTLEPTEQVGETTARATAYLQSKLRNAEVAESMGMLPNLVQRWTGLHGAQLEASGHQSDVSHRLTAWSKFVRYSQQSLSLGFGALLVIDGQLSPGGMIAVNVLMTRALAPIDQLASAWRGFQATRSAFERLEALLEAHPERTHGQRTDRPQGHCALRGVVAKAGEHTILSNIDLDIPAGSVTVVLGASGSGKSTLGRVLTGIWPETSGEVLLDGTPLSDWNRVALGQHVGYLPQDIELMDGSIAENIARFGEVDPDQVIAATTATGLHDMILRFPKGYDMPIGEGGGLLSGGQRQRIALARAIYGSPTLLVLDEPNANLDDVGEAALAGAVKQLKAEGKTVVLISHRPGIVAVADRLVVMHRGQIDLSGDKDEVLAAMAARKKAAQAAAQPAQTGVPAIAGA